MDACESELLQCSESGPCDVCMWHDVGWSQRFEPAGFGVTIWSGRTCVARTWSQRFERVDFTVADIQSAQELEMIRGFSTAPCCDAVCMRFLALTWNSRGVRAGMCI